MSEIKRILAITNNFPTPRFPEKGVFVKNILQEFNRQGIEVDVIAPISFGTELKRIMGSSVKPDYTGLNVKQPYYFAFPQRLKSLRKVITKVNNFLFGISLKWSFKNRQYDVIYAHFLQSAIPAIQYLPLKGVPILINMGESDPWDYDLYYRRINWVNYLIKASYIVTVSKVNYEYVLSLNTALTKRTRYIPNGVNIEFFQPYDKKEARQRLGLALDSKYAIFCGHFDERKGPLRVLSAIKSTGIKGIFLGSNGPDVPTGDEVAFAGAVKNCDVPLYLSACDVFVLPSRSEGMSNAVLEAMSCCIPVVVSDMPFNTDFIKSESAVFVNPNDVESIRKGILRAMDPKVNQEIRNCLVVQRQDLSIETRIKKILAFIWH